MFYFIEKFINQALSWDPKAQKKLLILKGKRLRLEVEQTPFVFDVQFFETGLRIKRNSLSSNPSDSSDTSEPSDTSEALESQPDVIVKGPLSAFTLLKLTKDPHQAARQGLQVLGDLETGQMIQSLMLELNIDWEEAFSKLTNDTVAHQSMRFLKKVGNLQKDFFSSFSHSLSDYLKEEIKITPREEEMEDFLNKVDNLKHDVERLEARFGLIEQAVSEPQ